MYEADSELSPSFQLNSSSDQSVLTKRLSSSGTNEKCSPTDTIEK